MKILIKLMILALALSYASLFVIKNPDGTPIKTLDSLLPSFDFMESEVRVDDMVSTLSDFLGTEDESGTGTDSMQSLAVEDGTVRPDTMKYYRWQDEEGSWHYTDSPPPGVRAEEMETAPVNIMTLMPVANTDTGAGIPEDTMQTAESESTLIPEQIRQMQETLQQAEQVGNQLQERFEEQQRILDEL